MADRLACFVLFFSRETVRACALCNCVERSLHGQRELRCFGPSSDRPSLEPSVSSLPAAGNDDLSSIGFSESTCLASLFDDTGMMFQSHLDIGVSFFPVYHISP